MTLTATELLTQLSRLLSDLGKTLSFTDLAQILKDLGLYLGGEIATALRDVYSLASDTVASILYGLGYYNNY